ncbi:MAG: hypothetical protein L0G63_01230 [Psychrobacter sp.]|uniref:hypothetical protein n=1 Tax=Psychrobacter sp. TaxID=56811 RepID=UPI002649D9CA|nr:hypothetical protein [Psychrobacter sp.]MDN5619092.1 hypothetical protein [Psychrobacter sp.]
MTTPETKIKRSDLQFFPSERLTDNDDGGGMPLGTPISGEANELFNPISNIARVNGGFYARLMYAGVQRIDDEPLIGSFAAITKPPSDPTVSYLLSRATKFGELRHEALDRVEAYNVATIESRMLLLSTQSQNSRLVQAYQRVGEPLPLVGDVYCLRQNKAGYPKHEQYIQVTRVTSEDRTFVAQSSGSRREFTVTVVKMEISAKLQADFVGSDYPVEGYTDNPCKIRETAVADAAQYYGVKPLASPITLNDITLQVPSLMDKIVPTNQVEVRLTDLTAAGQRQTLLDSSKTGAGGIITLSINKSHSTGSTTALYTGNAITPGTLVIDTAAGQIKDKGSALVIGETVVGSVNQAAGEVTINGASFSGYITSLEFRPAGSELQVGDTASTPVTINNRGYIWSRNINPPPAPGSLLVSYRAQGRWYDLRDSGDGVLRGASAAHGSGSVNFVTGSVEISTGELPDVGSSVMFTWGGRARYFNRSDQASSAKMLLTLSQAAVPSSLSLTWNDGTAKTAVSDARGNITGDWTGKYNAKTRELRIDTGANFNHPAGALDITVQYSTGEVQQSPIVLSATNISDKVSFTAHGLLPNTLQIDYELPMPLGFGELDGNFFAKRDQKLEATITDDSNGNLINRKGVIVGSIDYASGAGEFDPSMTFNLPKAIIGAFTEIVFTSGGNGGMVHELPTKTTFAVHHYEYEDVLCTLPSDDTTNATLFSFADGSDTAVTDNLASGPIEIDLLPNYSEVVTPSSVNFSWAGKSYFDREGRLYTDLNPSNGAATAVGDIDYQSGRATLTTWQWVNGSPATLTSLLTSLTGNPVDQVTFRTPSAPLRPDSLNVWATAVDGTRISAVANAQGNLKAANIEGVVDVEYGVASVQFGAWVAAAGNESEPWYSADAVTTDGQIWQPKSVFAETITYNATSYSYLPIDSNVVKIDTVRLPQDGRIPIFRRGDTIIIGNRVTTDIGSAHTGGQTVTLPRNDVTRIAVSDADDTPVNAELWDYDLAAGTITWRTPLDLSMYKMPLKVMHAQEERNRIIQADIDGTLTLLFAMRRSYPIADTYVSSVLIGGDLQVRVSIPFTQRNWDNVWRDEPKGDQLLNKLNLKDYPMVLTDDGAIKERWMIKMTGTNTFELYGETLGFVMRGDTLTDLAPINPATGKPYFTLPKQAFGSDAPWASQDIIRFNTWGTLLPIWVLCAVQPNPNPPTGTDGYTQCLYGDTTEITV